jgi:Domain of unknown function (DUF6457)
MDWIDELAAMFGVEAPSVEETRQLLDVARDVAHSVERKITPLSTFVLGLAVQERMAAGEARDVAFAHAIAELRTTLPAAAPPSA